MPTQGLVRRCHPPRPCRRAPNITSTSLTPTTGTLQHLIPPHLQPFLQPSRWALLQPHTFGKPRLVTPRWFPHPSSTSHLLDRGVAFAKSRDHRKPKLGISSRWKSTNGVFRTSWRNRWTATTNHPNPVFIADRDRAQVLQLTKSSRSRQHRPCARVPNPSRPNLPVIITTTYQDSHKDSRNILPWCRAPSPPKCEGTWRERWRVLLRPSLLLLLPPKLLYFPESDR